MDRADLPEPGPANGAGPRVGKPSRLEVLGHIAAGTAHELNNWFFVIRGFSELARFDVGDDHPIADKLDRIEEAIDRAELLNRVILECAHPSGGRPFAIHLHPLVKEAVKSVRGSLGSDVELRQAVETEAPRVSVDPVRFYPAALALIELAAERASARHGRLWVALGPAGDELRQGAPAVALSIGWTVASEGDEVWRQLGSSLTSSLEPWPADRGAAAMEEVATAVEGRVEHRTLEDRGASFCVILPAASDVVLG